MRQSVEKTTIIAGDLNDPEMKLVRELYRKYKLKSRLHADVAEYEKYNQ